MSKLSWYWHRLRAMSPAEMGLHARKKWRQAADAKRQAWPEVDLAGWREFPGLPKREDAPPIVREALRHDVENILAGRWKFFGHLDLQVDDPPKWQCDYLVRRDLETAGSAFQLNYRSLPEGVDSKLLWEPSRWYQLVRLAMAAYVLDDRRAGEKCLDWLEDWVRHNPPYRGWNWTSALEAGMRLIQFTWIDALLGEGDLRFANDDLRADDESGNSSVIRRSEFQNRLARLRQAILPSHVWYAWRHRSFGSSANNHLLGELAGCIVATTRWPGLANCGASLEELQRRWEREVLSQFAEDGGNKEQALNYQLFSWEFCWHTFKALNGARPVSGAVQQRLVKGGRFFWELQACRDHWDYGDSDNGSVVPLFASWERPVDEWHQWFEAPAKSPALAYWLGEPPLMNPPIKRGAPLSATVRGDWFVFEESGVATAEIGYWWLRWDLSPLGYLQTAAHGHLDALHLSIWIDGVALVIDPGTGAYHADKRVRNWLASRAAHNAPCPFGPETPRRLGPFLWAEHHDAPKVEVSAKLARATLRLPNGTLARAIQRVREAEAWVVADAFEPASATTPADFTVRWQFAPGCWIKKVSERKYSVHRADAALTIELNESWAEVELVEPVDAVRGFFTELEPGQPLEGLVSPAFRQLCRAPFLKLTARPPGDKPCVFTTTFLASPRS